MYIPLGFYDISDTTVVKTVFFFIVDKNAVIHIICSDKYLNYIFFSLLVPNI